MNINFDKYQSINQETRWATTAEIKHSSTHIDLNSDSYPTAGIPVMSDAHDAYVDGTDTHTLIFGATGSKKTRLFCMPTLNFFIRAGESFIATDPKGELYNRTSGMAKAYGYDTIVLNFRNIGKGDRWNPLSLPYQLYHNGEQENAIALLNDFIRTIASPQFEGTKDIFWPEMASSLALANLLLLMEAAEPDEINVASLAALCSNDALSKLENLSSHMRTDTIAGLNYKNVLTSPEKTMQSILAVLFGMVRIFTTQKELTNMLSGNSIDIASIGRQKTAVYLIIPDEKSTYHFLITTFIKQAYELLIAEAQKHQNGMLPVRVNFVLDEFCNLPKIPDMPSMISAARSRNMRYYLVAQSLHQLKGRYGEDADTIKGNCDNWIFLTSKELDLLKEISELCGTYYTADAKPRSLISISELQRLDKAKGEALIMHSRQYPFITEIADIDDYEMFKGYPAKPLQDSVIPDAKMFDLEKFYKDVKAGRRVVPFSQVESDTTENNDSNSEEASQDRTVSNPEISSLLPKMNSFNKSPNSVKAKYIIKQISTLKVSVDEIKPYLDDFTSTLHNLADFATNSGNLDLCEKIIEAIFQFITFNLLFESETLICAFYSCIVHAAKGKCEIEPSTKNKADLIVYNANNIHYIYLAKPYDQDRTTFCINQLKKDIIVLNDFTDKNADYFVAGSTLYSILYMIYDEQNIYSELFETAELAVRFSRELYAMTQENDHLYMYLRAYLNYASLPEYSYDNNRKTFNEAMALSETLLERADSILSQDLRDDYKDLYKKFTEG